MLFIVSSSSAVMCAEENGKIVCSIEFFFCTTRKEKLRSHKLNERMHHMFTARNFDTYFQTECQLKMMNLTKIPYKIVEAGSILHVQSINRHVIT